MKIAILVYNGMTMLDAIGSYEVLAQLPDAEVFFVAKKRGTVKSDTEFVKIIELSSLDASCVDNPVVSQVKPRVSFGQYKGMLYTELPDSYILWLKENYSGAQKNILKEELKYRGL